MGKLSQWRVLTENVEGLGHLRSRNRVRDSGAQKGEGLRKSLRLNTIEGKLNEFSCRGRALSAFRSHKLEERDNFERPTKKNLNGFYN